MARGNVGVYKVFYKGETDDFVVYVDDVASVKQWRKDKTVPLAQVVSGWKIFITHRHGAQGIHDGASKATLSNEFGTSDEVECITKILEKGDLQESEEPLIEGTASEDIQGIKLL
ncbi:uncharacterized protein ARB_07549 [Trichophyton benhamiae CBS 112371]|uniref:Ribosome maturation protein SDO1/SBDS N-terminal domain-containing protein n=1 Tax=Arthroderma benhamiae (strain ATCC MYA-4681 / CBS 112371) TaxID=663331 RepID=D4ATI5_ARTBC|nr:uncharacterized protein ARB_07549 [Trichophyton benhamiae CBS 112371]EFE33604.1 hypothetical protein ARB_07549 [Trichophyton benhamiae CBS 112371]